MALPHMNKWNIKNPDTKKIQNSDTKKVYTQLNNNIIMVMLYALF